MGLIRGWWLNHSDAFRHFQVKHNVHTFQLLVCPITIVFVLPVLNSNLESGGALSTDFQCR